MISYYLVFQVSNTSVLQLLYSIAVYDFYQKIK